MPRPARVSRLRADDRLRAALVRLLRSRQARFDAEMSRAAQGQTVESVHQSRVAARSLRSIIGTLGAALEPRLVSSIQRDLRASGLELGSMRESDVRRKWLVELAGESGLEPALFAGLQRALDRECASARRAFRGYAHSTAARERLDRLEAAFASGRLVIAPAAGLEAGFEEFLRRRLRKRWKRLLRAIAAPRPDALALHEIRILAKHARYSTEALLPLFGVDPGPVVKPLRRLQACLGDHHDAFEALAWLERRKPPAGPAVVERLQAPIEARMKAGLRRFRRQRRALAMPKAIGRKGG
jgi:CHAD domain-containing protein